MESLTPQLPICKVAKIGASGMGLAITQAMLASHGGTIRPAEAGGRGAHFEITLPALG